MRRRLRQHFGTCAVFAWDLRHPGMLLETVTDRSDLFDGHTRIIIIFMYVCMMNRLQNKALITGGSSGMGLEYARQLAAREYDLVLVSNRQEELETAAQALREQFPVQVVTRFQDLAAADAADALFHWCTKEEGFLPDVVINNAGMFFFKELQAEDLDKVQAMVNLHLVTVTRMCLLFGNAMKQRGSGYLLNMSSMAARIPAPGITVYSATKAYLRQPSPRRFTVWTKTRCAWA